MPLEHKINDSFKNIKISLSLVVTPERNTMLMFNLKVKITQICLICDQTFVNLDV